MRPQAGVEHLHDVGELPGHPFQAAGEQFQVAVGGAMGLYPDAVVLVFGGAASAELGEYLRGTGQSLGQHGPHRVAGPHPDLFHRGQPALGQR